MSTEVGLRIDLVSKAPGAQSYKELCVAAKNEERQFAELKRKRQYNKESLHYQTSINSQQQASIVKKDDKKQSQKQTRCYTCNSPDHLACDCKAIKSESRGKLWIVKTGGKSTKLCTSSSRIVDSIFPPVQASISMAQDIQHILYKRLVPSRVLKCRLKEYQLEELLIQGHISLLLIEMLSKELWSWRDKSCAV